MATKIKALEKRLDDLAGTLCKLLAGDKCYVCGRKSKITT